MPYDPTAPYRGAVDFTSEYLMPGVAALDRVNPAGIAGRYLSKHLRAPAQRGAQVLGNALQGVPPIGPVGLVQNMAGMMAPEAQAVPTAAPAAPAARGLQAAPPPTPAPPPMPMPQAAPAPAPAPARPPSRLAGTLAAPAAPGSTALAQTPTAPASAPGTAVRPEDDRLREQQDALDEYYSGVIGTGPGQRRAERMFALSDSLRGGGRGTGWKNEAADAISGLTRAYTLYKGLGAEKEREGKLDDVTQQYLRRRRGPGLVPEAVPGQFSTADPKYG